MRWPLPLLLCLTHAASQDSAPLVPRGGPSLRPFSTWTYQLDGVRYGLEIYFVDALGLKRAVDKDPRAGAPLALLRRGKVWYGRRMTFLTDVSGAKRRQLLRDLLRQHWPSKAFPENRPDVASFLDWQGRAFNQGDVVEYMLAPGGSITIRFNLSHSRRFDSPDLTQAMRNMLLSEVPGNPGRLDKLDSDLKVLLQTPLP